MKVEGVFPQQRRLWVRLHEKGGKEHAMPCHTILEYRRGGKDSHGEDDHG
jgi:hypothetical protein